MFAVKAFISVRSLTFGWVVRILLACRIEMKFFFTFYFVHTLVRDPMCVWGFSYVKSMEKRKIDKSRSFTFRHHIASSNQSSRTKAKVVHEQCQNTIYVNIYAILLLFVSCFMFEMFTMLCLCGFRH